jgi:hypothetical protein
VQRQSGSAPADTEPTPPQSNFLFKHALVQDAAYSTLLRSQRKELHARIGKVLEEQFPGTADTQLEILAHHFNQAGLVDRAIEYWRRAGLRSVGRSAHSEAAAHFVCALELLGRQPSSGGAGWPVRRPAHQGFASSRWLVSYGVRAIISDQRVLGNWRGPVVAAPDAADSIDGGLSLCRMMVGSVASASAK